MAPGWESAPVQGLQELGWEQAQRSARVQQARWLWVRELGRQKLGPQKTPQNRGK
jgi:hypothetical protein